ncbi:MAG: type VI secretion system protein TssA [Terracidiphilus sp.]
MPLRDDLLNPIPGANPSGASLRYEKVYDQIKEARSEGEASILGNLAAPKRADLPLVIKLAGEALATKSKDLQLAAWLAESLIKKEGVGVVQSSLKLFQDLQEQFWDTLYPEIDEGDAGMRAVPLEWAANRISEFLGQAPITRDGLNFYQYRESRAVGYEADAKASNAKVEARQLAIKDGKVTGEDFDKSFASTPKSWYVQMSTCFQASMETLEALQRYCEEKYGDDGPGFGKLRTTLEEVGHTVETLLNEKRKTEPDPVVVEVAPEPVEEDAAPGGGAPESEGERGAQDGRPQEPAGGMLRLRASAGQLNGPAQAYAQTVESALFLFEKNPNSPVPYLVCAGLRMGETLMQEAAPAPGFAVGPSADVRRLMRTLADKGAWKDLLRESLPVLGSECARAWLDLHRYIWMAGKETGAAAISLAVTSTLKNLLAVRPELRHWTLEDDTGAANPETQKWLDSTVLR